MEKEKPVAVTLGWNLKPTLLFEDGKVLFGRADKILYPEYFQHGDWPTYPGTDEKLPVAGDVSAQVSNYQKIVQNERRVFVNGKEIPVENGIANNLTVIDGRIFNNGKEYVDGKWKRTFKAFLYKHF